MIMLTTTLIAEGNIIATKILLTKTGMRIVMRGRATAQTMTMGESINWVDIPSSVCRIYCLNCFSF